MGVAARIAGLIWVWASVAASAQGLHPPVDPVVLGELRWSAPFDDPTTLFARRSRPLLKPLSAEAALGELLFRSPWLLGGMARRLGLSCDTCHPNGHRNERFFFAGASDRPGTFDPTNAVFNPAKDDGHFAPIDIPSLRAIAGRGSFGKAARDPSLKSFVESVVVDEFQGVPTSGILAALVAYLETLGPSDAPDAPATLEADIDDIGRWSALISPLLDRGETSLALLAIASLRSELGRLHERFPGDDLETERDILGGMAVALGRVAEFVEAGDGEGARRRLRAWTVAFEDFDRGWLLAAEPRTLYDLAARSRFFNTRRP